MKTVRQPKSDVNAFKRNPGNISFRSVYLYVSKFELDAGFFPPRYCSPESKRRRRRRSEYIDLNECDAIALTFGAFVHNAMIITGRYNGNSFVKSSNNEPSKQYQFKFSKLDVC